MVNNQTVDLAPLFRWWTNHTGARPLTGWVHLTGAIVATNSWGWVLEVKADNPNPPKKAEEKSDAGPNGPTKIMLRHPPLDDLVEFNRLKAELQPLNDQRKQLVDQETQAKQRAQTVANQRKAVNRNSVEARELALEGKQLTSASQLADNEIKLLDVRIRPLKEKLAAYPNTERYVVDCFALDTGKEAQALPIYDHGSAFQ